jgi:excisionase family DNA binding protein
MVPCMTRQPRYFTVTEVVAELRAVGINTTTGTVRRWVRQGRVPALLVGGLYRLHPAVVEALKAGTDPNEARFSDQEAEHITT